MALDSEVKKMFEENPILSKYLTSNPQLETFAYQALAQKYEENKYLLYGAKFVDKVKRFANAIKLPFDMGLGKILGYFVRGAANLLEQVVELPYALYYVGKTKGKYLKPMALWGARAALQYIPSVPGIPGDIAGMVKLYEPNVKKYIRKATADYLISKIKEQKVAYVPQASPESIEEIAAAEEQVRRRRKAA